MAKSRLKPKKKTNRSRLLAQITPRDGSINRNMDRLFQIPNVPVRIRSAEEEAKRMEVMGRRIKKKGY